MQRRTFGIAAATLAALSAFPLQILAQSPSLQDARPRHFALPAERTGWDDDKVLALRALTPGGVAGAEIGWVKAGELRPGSALQLELEQGWALCAGWDRQRTRLPQVRETIDTVLLGLQYKFP